MRSASLVCAAAVILLSLTACTVTSDRQYIKTDAQGQVTRLQRYVTHQGVEYNISAELTAALTLDKTGSIILAMPQNSYIQIQSTDHSLSFAIERQHQHTTHILSINGATTDNSPQSRHHAEQLTLMLFRNTPVEAKGRVSTLLAYQGADKVLNEISLITDQETKRLYITELATQAALTEQQHLQLIQSTDTIQSDYALTELLLSQATIVPKPLAVQKAILKASHRITSDYEKRRLLSQLVKPQSGFSVSSVLQASQDIESDYELGQVLQQSAPQVRDDKTLDAVLAAAETMQSSYELQQALRALPFEHLTTTQNERVIKMAAVTIQSDYELANTLIDLLSRAQNPLALQSAVTEALKSISSDSDKVRVFERFYSKH